MGTANHRVNIVRIKELLKHPNADSLSLVEVEGYQVVVKTENYQVGDLVIYVQPDSIVPVHPAFEFLWADKEFPDGVVPEKYRRITVRRFRKEWSEGLILPLREFTNGLVHDDRFKYGWLKEGDDVAEALGITHYVAPEPVESTQATRLRYSWPPKSFRDWVYYLLNLIGIDLNKGTGGLNVRGPKDQPPVYDVENLKNYKNTFEEGEQVVITEKIHGSNARYTFDGKKFFVGSRKLWKSEKFGCVWRKAAEQDPWIEQWCRAYPGFTLYGEVVPTQEGFRYGCEEGQVKFFAFDIRTPDGEWIKPFMFGRQYSGTGVTDYLTAVPHLYAGAFSMEEALKLVDGPSKVLNAKNIREGIVINTLEERHVRGLGRAQLKLVSNKFLEKQ